MSELLSAAECPETRTLEKQLKIETLLMLVTAIATILNFFKQR